MIDSPVLCGRGSVDRGCGLARITMDECGLRVSEIVRQSQTVKPITVQATQPTAQPTRCAIGQCECHTVSRMAAPGRPGLRLRGRSMRGAVC